jgi:MFS transporter, DHA1 family, multidrug resistance protein
MMPVLREPSASRRIVAVLLLLMPVGQVAVDASTPALPQMVDELHPSNEFMQNTVTAFMLGITVAVLPVGLIADALGRKRIVLAGLALMVLTSIGCALVESPTLLLGLRFVQGVGASVSLLAATVAATTSAARGWSPSSDGWGRPGRRHPFLLPSSADS